MDLNTCFETTKDYHAIAFYSHLIPAMLTFVVSTFVLVESKFSLVSKVFALFTGSFCVWLLGDVILWTSDKYDLVSFFWAPLDYINILAYLFGAYFFAILIREKDIYLWQKIIIAILALPAWWITFNNQSISAFYQPTCEALNNDFLSQYKFGIEVLVIAFVMFYGLWAWRKASNNKRWQIVTVGFALVMFFASFSVTEYISSKTGIYEINLYSLFVLPVFLFIIIYSITNLEILKIRLIGSQLLAYVLVIMVGSQFFFLKDTSDKTFTVITFLLSLGFGILLVKSGKREVGARKKIEKLAMDLEQANDQLQELDRQKDSVLHMVAHQFKGPLTTINYTTELLLDGTYGSMDAEQKDSITTIRKASQKMGLQSEMVLDAAKITLNKLPLSPEPINLADLMKEVVEEASNHAKERRVHFDVVLPVNPLPTATLDRKYTQLALDNLLSNAVKYTALKAEWGNVNFNVELRNNTLFCAVKDNGIGIPKAEQGNIFKELYRASNAGKEGNGLGLRVARGAIEAQGGKMTYESQENVGTTFYIELPLKLVPLVDK